MANEIGLELQDPEQPSPDRRQGAFAKFFSDPKNIASALVFGAALTQPRTQGQDGLGTLMQRAAGAAAFRGALESGTRNQQLKREETAFQRAQAEREMKQRDRQLDISQSGVDVQNTQLMLDQSQFERKMQQDETLAAQNADLQKSLAGMRNPVTDADWAKIAMDSVPYLLQTMEFDEGTTPTQKMAMAQIQAWRGVELYRAMLADGAKTVVGPNGQLLIDDGKGNQTPAVPGGPQAAPPAAPTPAPAPAAPRETPTQAANRVRTQQDTSEFAPTFGQRVERRAAENAVVREQASRKQAMSVLRGRAMNFQRLLEIGGRPTAQHVKELAFFTDDELQQMGMRPQVIVGLRQLAERLPTQ